MAEVQAQGRKANKGGSTLEKTVRDVLKAKGFTEVTYHDYMERPDKYGNEVLLTNAPYTSIYGRKSKTEFLLKSIKYNLNVRIECKWQQTQGSVDEKFPYLYLNCIETMPEKDIFVVVDGDGFRAEAVQWLKTAVNMRLYRTTNSPEKTIKVMDLKDFLIWANNTIN